jgi:bifunctional pyridoxal-dependent enzyme with beta-cystathionase and maltose regulon repressor activities
MDLVQTFDDLQELRGWLWEYYVSSVNKNPTNEEIEKEVIKKLEPICEKYGLHIVTD